MASQNSADNCVVPSPAALPTSLLAARLDRLFDAGHLISDPPQSDQFVAEAVSDEIGRAVRSSDIAQLRSGNSDVVADPRLLSAIANHFDVPAVYLTVDDETGRDIDQQLRHFLQIRDANLPFVALRGDANLSTETIDELSNLIQRVNRTGPDANA